MSYASQHDDICGVAKHVASLADHTRYLLAEMESAISQRIEYKLTQLWPLHLVAIEWVTCGFTVDSAIPWWDAGCWCPLITARLRDAGVDPGTAALRYTPTGHALGESCCDGDVEVKDVVSALFGELAGVEG